MNTTAALVSGTPNSCEIGSMIRKKIVKSKESTEQPSQAAHLGEPLILARLLPPSVAGRLARSVRLPTALCCPRNVGVATLQ